jgi:hypothetical protein
MALLADQTDMPLRMRPGSDRQRAEGNRVVTPTTLYAGTLGGGMLRSADGGLRSGLNATLGDPRLCLPSTV